MSWDNSGWQDRATGGSAWGGYQQGGSVRAAGGASGEERRWCPGDKLEYTFKEYMDWAVESFGSEEAAQQYWEYKMKPCEPESSGPPAAAVEEQRILPADKQAYTWSDYISWAKDDFGSEEDAKYYWDTKMMPIEAGDSGGGGTGGYGAAPETEEKRLCSSDGVEYTLTEYLSWAVEYFEGQEEAMKYWNERMAPVGSGNSSRQNWSSWGKSRNEEASGSNQGWSNSGAAGGSVWNDWGEDPSSWAPNLKAIDWQGAQLIPVEKDFYVENPIVAKRSPQEVEEIRRQSDIEIVDVSEMGIPNPVTTFEEASFPDWLEQQIRKKNWRAPTPIQIQVWPVALQGRDLVGIAETGSGKTLAYLLPLMVHIMAQDELKAGEGPVGVVLCPTRELALQIHGVCDDFIGVSGLRATCVYGGAPVKEQGRQLCAKNDIVIGTPGRFIHLLNEQWTNLNRVTYVVLDEADEMLQKGFGIQVNLILSQIRPDRQVLMFSATWGQEVQKLARTHCREDPVTVRIGGDRLAACKSITQNVLYLESEREKFDKLKEAVMRSKCHRPGNRDKCLIFCRTKYNADVVGELLAREGIQAGVMHSDKEQSQRIATLDSFKNGDLSVMAATNCLGRGHDIPRVRYVINYDAPDEIENYIHRVGRTGRAGETGFAMTFLTQKDAKIASPLIEVLQASAQKIPAHLQELATNFAKMSSYSYGGVWNETAHDWNQPEAEAEPHATLRDFMPPGAAMGQPTFPEQNAGDNRGPYPHEYGTQGPNYAQHQ